THTPSALAFGPAGKGARDPQRPRTGFVLHIAGLLVLGWTGTLFSFAVDRAHADAVPAAECAISLPGNAEDWLPQERRAGSRMCIGCVGDLWVDQPAGRPVEVAVNADAGPARQGTPDCSEANVLRFGFLDAILFREPMASSIPRQGVRISGACFNEALSLEGGILHHSLALTASHIPMLDLTNSRIEGDVRLSATTVIGPLKLDGARVEGALIVDSGARLSGVSLYGAKVGGNVVMRGTTVTSALDLDHAEIAGGFLASDNTRFSQIKAFGASIASDFDLRGSTVLGLLAVSNARIGGNL